MAFKITIKNVTQRMDVTKLVRVICGIPLNEARNALDLGFVMQADQIEAILKLVKLIQTSEPDVSAEIEIYDITTSPVEIDYRTWDLINRSC